MTDLDKKVKEVVEEFNNEYPELLTKGIRAGYYGVRCERGDIDILATRIQSLCQQDAERREEEAINYAVIMCTPDIGNPMLGDYQAHLAQTQKRVCAAYKQSREGQEGDKT